MFAILEEVLGKQYTLVAVDLPFHGQTEWNDQTFTKSDLESIIDTIRESEGKTRFNLMGFSFGARLLLATLPEYHALLDRLILLAPDGIGTKGMSMAVRTPMPVRRFLFKWLQRPDWFLKLVRFGHRLRVIPPVIVNFLVFNLPRADRFNRTFGCWFALNSFYLRRRRIRGYLQQSAIPVDIFYGTKDEMVRYKSLKKLAAALPKSRLIQLDAGHRVVSEKLKNAMN